MYFNTVLNQFIGPPVIKTRKCKYFRNLSKLKVALLFIKKAANGIEDFIHKFEHSENTGLL